MKWRGDIKPVHIELPTDLHQAMRSAAPARGVTAREAYIEAATTWLEKDSPETHVVGTGDVDLDRAIQAFVTFYKRKNKSDIEEAILKSFMRAAQGSQGSTTKRVKNGG